MLISLLDMATVYLALGSNVGDSESYIKQAVEMLGSKISHIKIAPIYRSKAVGYTDQADFFNTVIVGQTELDPRQLLKFVKKIEPKVGRIARFRWGPREIDIDIIFYDNKVLDESNLIIPHPRFSQRDFVLKPICDLDPKQIDPRSGLSVSELYAKLPKDQLSIY
jgi:2-amino-4-hydroxy-6-hydroxymethyldihydropteridine diphosphokinase